MLDTRSFTLKNSIQFSAFLKANFETALCNLDLNNFTVLMSTIADHNAVVVTLAFKAPRESITERVMWQFAEADWDLLEESVDAVQWDIVNELSASEGAAFVTETVLQLADSAIPQRSVEAIVSTHPWLNSATTEAVAAKRDAFGTPNQLQATKQCSWIIAREYGKYVKRAEKKLRQMKPGSKQWWS